MERSLYVIVVVLLQSSRDAILIENLVVGLTTYIIVVGMRIYDECTRSNFTWNLLYNLGNTMNVYMPTN